MVKGVLSSFQNYVEKNEPIKKNRPKLLLRINDKAVVGQSGIITDKSIPSETCRLIEVEIVAELNKEVKTLHKQGYKIHNMLGIFHENDPEGERDVSMFVEMAITSFLVAFGVIGAVTAINNSFYGNER